MLDSERGSLVWYGDVRWTSSIFVHVDVGWEWSVGSGWFEVVGCDGEGLGAGVGSGGTEVTVLGVGCSSGVMVG